MLGNAAFTEHALTPPIATDMQKSTEILQNQLK
jgi:hypothetical protein